jgi:hypothetical protein
MVRAPAFSSRQLVIYGAGEWSDVYEPSRKPVSAVTNYIRENVTAIKNFAECLMPSEIDSAEDLKAGEGGVMREGAAKMPSVATCKGPYTAAPQRVRILAVTCTGIRPNNAGIVRAAAPSSVRTVPC